MFKFSEKFGLSPVIFSKEEKKLLNWTKQDIKYKHK